MLKRACFYVRERTNDFENTLNVVKEKIQKYPLLELKLDYLNVFLKRKLVIQR